ncbi:Lrp/AsnC family transcriptional regulator [Brevibacillus ruminantium]|uniref:Lrp/AsnC family transcriptional regulator n=1 Tax=Brevibacillus ruminantium TaxID=2950604 RepID=A0ABY4WGV4_9BACL|nr:Lrp/AsnC family transcriptional regulator [Brevibacillus ruminantium]USG66388.1 Lrp/AsnC family transcriptional regulator [Brevibacillus ruminantium]
MEGKMHRSLFSQLDDLDYAIANALQENARLPFTQIAKDLDVTEKTVRMRVQQMQEEGVLSLVGVVNPVKVGLNVQVYIQIAVEACKLDDVVAALNEIYEARLVVLTSGEYQLIIQVLLRDYDELSEFLMTKLNKIDGITKVNVINMLKVIKSRFKFIR